MSEKNSLVVADLKKWGKNLLIFAAPLVVIYLTPVVLAIKATGLTLAAFTPDVLVLGAMALYVLNAIMDLARKYTQGPVVTQ